MSKQLELYEIALANCENNTAIDELIEIAAFDETITDSEYCELYEKATNKIRGWLWGK